MSSNYVGGIRLLSQIKLLEAFWKKYEFVVDKYLCLRIMWVDIRLLCQIKFFDALWKNELRQGARKISQEVDVEQFCHQSA